MRTNRFRKVVKFLRENILDRHGIPRLILTDQGAHFDDRSFDDLRKMYSILHRLATPYISQINGQVELFNR